MSASDVSTHANPVVPVPRRRDALWFEFRALCLRVRRTMRNALDRRHRRHPISDALRDAPVIGEVRTPLWPEDDTPERVLMLGKIQNLRVARRAFDGVVLRRGETMSFWAQLGRASRARGFVVGRELREGCLIPSVGGGLCQLSNALYQAAQEAGLEIVERHGHTQVVPGSAAVFGKDATVFWNYVDLRLRAPFDLRVEVALDHEALHVRIRGRREHAHASRTLPLALVRDGALAADAHGAGDCATCGRDACFRHAPLAADDPAVAEASAVLADALWPEHERFLATLSGVERLHVRDGVWSRVFAHLRAWRLRIERAPPARRALVQANARARLAAQRLRPEHLDVHVDQAWLPTLWRSGVLAGRRVHVLMRALPMAEIQHTLDIAAQRHPDEPTLRDFRADPALVTAEQAALVAAVRWIGPHAEVMALAGDKAHALPWRMPEAVQRSEKRQPGSLRVLFPASSLVRKGALELAAALQGIDAEVWLPRRDGGDSSRWGALPQHCYDDASDALAHCDVVALPAWVEHSPRVLLAAIARGVPVVATRACGLGALEGWHEVPAGDAEALRMALMEIHRTLHHD